ncbi:CoA pyrophosphatase [Phenylobacterium sp.]|uniref:CoA pyrophosphatase n=1 Tax=Phenylobacterium sp. TaxID=1871053 RepID=UPI00272EF73A|nr:CoA pyrophosphatase [Phenylobacterium sp.]MDP1600491.1 CoA pyrophosphatase [Phenylobacterium sp.]MDP3591729.1 CoA pyrophosphatase [Phenylobacterium sp.]
MSPTAPTGELRAWIEHHLDPLEEGQSSEGASDFDLGANAFPNEPVELTPAAVLVGLIEREYGFSVLLTRRADTLRRHTGQIALPGGRCDPGETIWQTALREAHEEVGLAPDYVSLAGLSSPYRTGTGFLVTPVVGFIQPGFALQANPAEVADIFETPFGFLMDPANHEQHERQAPTGETRRFYAMTHEDRFIWGATAGMLRALYDRLYGAAVA